MKNQKLIVYKLFLIALMVMFIPCNSVGASSMAITAVEWGSSDNYIYAIERGPDGYTRSYRVGARVLYLQKGTSRTFSAPQGYKIIGLGYSNWAVSGYYKSTPPTNRLEITTNGGFNYLSPSYTSTSGGLNHWFFEYPSDSIVAKAYSSFSSSGHIEVIDAVVYLIPEENSIEFMLSQEDRDTLDGAKTEAINAKNAANTASARVWDATESKSAATLAKEARNKANDAKSSADLAKAEATNAKNAANTASSRAQDAVTKINSVATKVDNVNSEINGIKTQINNINSNINNIQSGITNIQNSVSPQIQKIIGFNGATCTQTSTFDVTVQASDAVEFRAKSGSGAWSGWVPLGEYATVTGLSSQGAHTIFVEAKSASGATTVGQKMVFRL